MLLQCGLKLSVLVLGSLGRGSGAGQSQLLPMPCIGSFGMSYKVIYKWFQLVLGLKVSGKSKVNNQAWLLLVLGLGSLTKR